MFPTQEDIAKMTNEQLVSCRDFIINQRCSENSFKTSLMMEMSRVLFQVENQMESLGLLDKKDREIVFNMAG